MVIEGKLHVKFDTVQASEKFQRRQFVVEYSDNPMYPQYISFELTQDRCSEMERFSIGDMIEVTFNLRGRPWKSKEGDTKYFNTLEAWRVQKVEGKAAPVGGNGNSSDAWDAMVGGENDDLPF